MRGRLLEVWKTDRLYEHRKLMNELLLSFPRIRTHVDSYANFCTNLSTHVYSGATALARNWEGHACVILVL
jgi:hypothetical protein